MTGAVVIGCRMQPFPGPGTVLLMESGSWDTEQRRGRDWSGSGGQRGINQHRRCCRHPSRGDGGWDKEDGGQWTEVRGFGNI